MKPKAMVHHVSGIAETLLGASYIPFKPQFRWSEKEVMIHCPEDLSAAKDPKGVKLKGYLNEHIRGTAKGMVFIMHGWHGSSHSGDSIDVGSHFHSLGYHTFRINFRDHGGTDSLNEGLFHGGLIEEMAEAARQVADYNPNLPFYIIGSSLGGNFALRMGVNPVSSTIPNLKKIVAICPAINPRRSAQLIDRNPLFRKYFCRPWINSLKVKKETYCEKFDYSLKEFNISVEGITETLHKKYFGYETLEDYFDTYTLTREKLKDKKIPTVIIASANDPVIAVDDIHDLHGIEPLSISLKRWGGHSSFIIPVPFKRLLPHMVSEQIMSY